MENLIFCRETQIYKQFFYQEQFVKLYSKQAPEKEVKIYNALIFPDYMGDTVRTNKTKEGILRLCAVAAFDLHKDRTIGIWQVNLQKLIEGRISSDEEVQKRMPGHYGILDKNRQRLPADENKIKSVPLKLQPSCVCAV